MTSRRGARRTAIEILYESDLRGQDPDHSIEARTASGEEISEFTSELVHGVTEHRPELDQQIARHTQGWTIERLAAVDRTILRVACYELLIRADVPVGAAIDEAVRAAKELSTEDSARFVNGVLGAIVREPGGDRPMQTPKGAAPAS